MLVVIAYLFEEYSQSFWLLLLSPPMRGAWIEIGMVNNVDEGNMSPPMRGAWIEILRRTHWTSWVLVAPHAGGVD